MRKGKKTKQPLKPRIVTGAETAAPAKAAPAASQEIVFSASRDAIELSGGKVTEWLSADAKVTASQDDPAAMPGFDARAGAVVFDKSVLTVSSPNGLEDASGLTVAISFKIADVKTSMPMTLISKGNYDSPVLYADVHEGSLRVKLGDGQLARIPLDDADGWVDLVLFTCDGAVHAVVNGKDHDCGAYTVIGQNADPLLIGARTQLGLVYCFLDGSIRHVRLSGADSTVDEAISLAEAVA